MVLVALLGRGGETREALGRGRDPWEASQPGDLSTVYSEEGRGGVTNCPVCLELRISPGSGLNPGCSQASWG